MTLLGATEKVKVRKQGLPRFRNTGDWPQRGVLFCLDGGISQLSSFVISFLRNMNHQGVGAFNIIYELR